MFVPNYRPRRKFLVAPDCLPSGFVRAGVNQVRVNALPECLSQRNLLSERKRHRFGDELLRGHDKKLAIQIVRVKRRLALCQCVVIRIGVGSSNPVPLDRPFHQWITAGMTEITTIATTTSSKCLSMNGMLPKK